MLKKLNLILNQADDGTQGGGTGEPNTETPAAPAKDAPKDEAKGDFDQFGYPIQPSQEGVQDKKDQTSQKSEQETSEESATGYGDTPPPEPKKDEVVPPAEPPKSLKEELGYELDLKDVEKADADKLVALAKAHKLPEDAAKALIEMKKNEVAAQKQAQVEAEKQQQIEIAKLKASWHEELSKDPNFGGEKFAHNLKRIDKVLSEFMSETKKVLTERKSMLPPYVMRDLAKLADHLYKTEKLVQGEASNKTEQKHWLNEYYS